jgi:hypothetical protein
VFPDFPGDPHDCSDGDCQARECEESKHGSIARGVARDGTHRRQESEQGCDEYDENESDGAIGKYFHRAIL